MTETGILNRDIAAELARMGHTDRLLIADAGLAIPDSTRVIDLSLAENVPTAVDVLKELLKHFSVGGYHSGARPPWMWSPEPRAGSSRHVFHLSCPARWSAIPTFGTN
ncbi:MAG: RbsD/FucU domain-containing protein [Flavonifractor plautii]